jgi:Skp family chaperone for outer membrane proteins
MKFLNLIKVVGFATIASLIFSDHALAQSTVLIVDQARVLRDSDVGKHVSRQIESIGKQMGNEMVAQLAPIKTERDKLLLELKTMSVEALKSRPDLQQRAQALQEDTQKSQLETKYKQTELQLTEQEAMKKINVTLETILKAIVAEKKADVILDRSVVIFTSPEADITDDIISRLNAQLKTVPVIRKRVPRKPLPQQANVPTQ